MILLTVTKYDSINLKNNFIFRIGPAYVDLSLHNILYSLRISKPLQPGSFCAFTTLFFYLHVANSCIALHHVLFKLIFQYYKRTSYLYNIGLDFHFFLKIMQMQCFTQTISY